MMLKRLLFRLWGEADRIRGEESDEAFGFGRVAVLFLWKFLAFYD